MHSQEKSKSVGQRRPRPISLLLLLVCGITAARQSGRNEHPNLALTAVYTAQPAAQDQSIDLQDLQIRLAPNQGDIDGMDKRRVVSALVSLSRTSFFFDNGRPRGMTYDALAEFEKFLNRKLHPNDRTG